MADPLGDVLAEQKAQEAQENEKLTAAKLERTNAIKEETDANAAVSKIKGDVNNWTVKSDAAAKALAAAEKKVAAKTAEIATLASGKDTAKLNTANAALETYAKEVATATSDKAQADGQIEILRNEQSAAAQHAATVATARMVANTAVTDAEQRLGVAMASVKKASLMQSATEGMKIQAQGPIVVTKTNYTLRPTESAFKITWVKWGFGVFVVLCTIVANAVMHVPAMIYSDDFFGTNGYKKIFWISFSVMYAMGVAFTAFMMYAFGKDGNLDMGLRGYFKNLLIFVIISALFGILMYYISQALTTKMHTQEQSVTGIASTVDQGRPIDIVVVCFVAMYVFILQMVCLLLLFGFSLGGGDGKGMMQGMFKSVLKLNRGYSENLAATMDQITSMIGTYGDTYDTAEMLARVATVKENGYGDYKELLTDLVRIAEKSRTPKANPARESEFQENLLNLLFKVKISKQGITTVENKQSDAKLKQIGLKLKAVEGEMKTIDGYLGKMCNSDGSMDAGVAKRVTVEFANSMTSIGQTEEETLQLLDTLTPMEPNFNITKMTLKMAHDYRTALLEKVGRFGEKLAECGKQVTPECAKDKAAEAASDVVDLGEMQQASLKQVESGMAVADNIKGLKEAIIGELLGADDTVITQIVTLIPKEYLIRVKRAVGGVFGANDNKKYIKDYVTSATDLPNLCAIAGQLGLTATMCRPTSKPPSTGVPSSMRGTSFSDSSFSDVGGPAMPASAGGSDAGGRSDAGGPAMPASAGGLTPPGSPAATLPGTHSGSLAGAVVGKPPAVAAGSVSVVAGDGKPPAVAASTSVAGSGSAVAAGGQPGGQKKTRKLKRCSMK